MKFERLGLAGFVGKHPLVSTVFGGIMSMISADLAMAQGETNYTTDCRHGVLHIDAETTRADTLIDAMHEKSIRDTLKAMSEKMNCSLQIASLMPQIEAKAFAEDGGSAMEALASLEEGSRNIPEPDIKDAYAFLLKEAKDAAVPDNLKKQGVDCTMMLQMDPSAVTRAIRTRFQQIASELPSFLAQYPPQRQATITNLP